MSGLDSIALAVAHLEEMSNRRQAEEPSSGFTQAGPNNSASIISAGTSHTDNHTPALVRASPSPTTMAMASEQPYQRQQQQQQQEAMPRPYSFVTAPNSRVVSSDNISTTFSNNDVKEISAAAHRQPVTQLAPKTENLVPMNAPHQPNSNLALILADPQAWLEATRTKPIPEPSSGVFEKVEDNDVLCGRGGESNHHAGNQQYRKLVKAFQPLYIASKRRYKPRIAQCIVFTIRSYGGRFLKRTGPHNNAFEDVGNTKAREKTSQALREGAPELRGSHPAGLESEGPESPTPKATAAPSNLQAPNGGGLPSNFMNPQHFLHAQLGPYHGAFGFHGAFAATLTPLQQALLMANHRSATAQSLPPPAAPAAAVLPHPTTRSPPAAAAAAVAMETKKRPINMVSSSEETSISSTATGVSTISVPSGEVEKVRGPRLKRLKHRLSKVNSDDETEQ